MSSAKSFTGYSKLSDKSLIQTREKNGTRMGPCDA